MPKSSDYKIDPDREGAFRRGYTHGAEAVLLAVSARLSEKEKTQLRRWASGALLDWHGRSAEVFEEPPDPPIL
jgi:hypothetical protein